MLEQPIALTTFMCGLNRLIRMRLPAVLSEQSLEKAARDDGGQRRSMTASSSCHWRLLGGQGDNEPGDSVTAGRTLPVRVPTRPRGCASTAATTKGRADATRNDGVTSPGSTTAGACSRLRSGFLTRIGANSDV